MEAGLQSVTITRSDQTWGACDLHDRWWHCSLRSRVAADMDVTLTNRTGSVGICAVCRFDLTWGPIEYHRRSLDNLQTAMKKSRKLCAIVLDTLGREVRTYSAQHSLMRSVWCKLVHLISVQLLRGGRDSGRIVRLSSRPLVYGGLLSFALYTDP